MSRNPTPHVTIKLNQAELKRLTQVREVQQKLESVADAVVEEAKSTVHVKTGNLRSHIRKRLNPEDGYDVGVFEGADYADIEEERHPFIRPALDAARKR
jgi:hypothetical protein